MPPRSHPAPYYRHSFDRGYWRFVGFDVEEGYAWFEPLADDLSPDGRQQILTAEARRVRYRISEMEAHWG
jgi:hypothetical protein